MNAKIIEIFNSIQGEGKYAGTRQVFVRFFECNMHCVWCDTPHSIGDSTRNFRTMNTGEIMDEVDRVSPNAGAVSLTGGEPLLQADFIRLLLPLLRDRGLKIHLDTNGTLPDELEKIIDLVDVVAMDLKVPSSTRQRSFWKEHREFLNVALKSEVFIKTVISSQVDLGDIRLARDIVAEADPDILFVLQPNSFDLGNGVMKSCHAAEVLCRERLNHVRVLPQMHKMLKVR